MQLGNDLASISVRKDYGVIYHGKEHSTGSFPSGADHGVKVMGRKNKQCIISVCPYMKTFVFV